MLKIFSDIGNLIRITLLRSIHIHIDSDLEDWDEDKEMQIRIRYTLNMNAVCVNVVCPQAACCSISIKSKDEIIKMKVAGNPIKISNFKDKIYRKAPPSLDQDRKKILRDFKIKEK